MANLDLSKYGIQDVKEIIHNPSYDVLFAEETKPGLEGFEKGQVTELGAVNVMTGIYTGRSPKDKFFVMNEASKDSVWWTSEEYKNDNKPCSEEAWADLKAKAVKQLSGKRLFVVDTFCGANPATRMKVRFIMEVAWQAHFVTNMFIRPTAEELANYGEPDFVSFNASKAKVDNYKELGLNSETATVFNLKTNEQVILNTWYGGEMKKGMFSIMNYKNPLRGIASMHCSANTNMEGTDSAIFFGLSGTGKTTLSTDPKRLLIGDDSVDDDVGAQLREGIYGKLDVGVLSQRDVLSGAVGPLERRVPADIDVVQLDPVDGQGVEAADGGVHVVRGFTGKAEHEVRADLHVGFFRQLNGLGRGRRVVPPVDAAQGGVVQGLDAKLKPFFFPRRGAEDSHFFRIEAVGPGSHGNPGEIGQGAENLQHRREPGGGAVGIGKGLQIREEQRGPVGLAEVLAPVLPLGGEVHSGKAEPRAGTYGVAEGAARVGERPVTVGAACPRVERDLLDPLA